MGRVSTYTTYRQVADDPHCQEILKWAAADASTQMSGEEFLDSVAKVVAVPIPAGAIGKGLSRGDAALGVTTGNTQTHVVQQPYLRP